MDRHRWLADLASPDERTRMRALRSACPCLGSSATYEEFMGIVAAMKKDPSPAVRRVAIHLEEDALDHLRQEDEHADGYFRNPPGGHGRRRQPSRVLEKDRPKGQSGRVRRYHSD
jgi:hypothetical protein